MDGTKWSQKLMEFLESREYEVHFGYLNKTTDAQIDREAQKININLPLYLATCFIHEFIHHKNGWDDREGERKTRRLEAAVLKKLTDGQINALGWRILEHWIVQPKGGK